ncbi:unnamed protein product [Rotaria sp. Silwood1]|nr:unnamed protein product [Rotaria sp. Silwood1]CAF3608489.1 unnamed protein product [Rotaria sp. Silwood1]CAF3632764.1 unnamed protein product [Rotaria sp. Silwood1]CAF4907201.1 unnamed protein product [Rotaria sp. Silwood1]CAF4942096.1 unnamed protein product [Rotaria sp. Silwood1]
MTLIIRIVKQKHRLNQHVNWRKHRKMAIQLISITLLFYFLYLPNVIVAIVFGCGVPWSYLENFLAYGQFFSYYINFLLPFVCAGTLPHLRNKIKKILQLWPWHTRSAIEPSHNTVMFKAAGQSIVPTRFVH